MILSTMYMESTYASQEEGGGKDINYIPNLTKLAEENISFLTQTNSVDLYHTKALGGQWQP